MQAHSKRSGRHRISAAAFRRIGRIARRSPRRFSAKSRRLASGFVSRNRWVDPEWRSARRNMVCCSSCWFRGSFRQPDGWIRNGGPGQEIWCVVLVVGFRGFLFVRNPGADPDPPVAIREGGAGAVPFFPCFLALTEFWATGPAYAVAGG